MKPCIRAASRVLVSSENSFANWPRSARLSGSFVKFSTPALLKSVVISFVVSLSFLRCVSRWSTKRSSGLFPE